MEEELRKVMIWASHGTPRQFYYEVTARLEGQGYEVDLEGEDVVRVHKSHREGGFLGIGGRKVKETFLEVRFGGEDVVIPPESADEELVKTLAGLLGAH
jgi:hypothetical protein